MKIYTRTGDAGETGLFDGTRVSKADPRVEAYGHVDELNAVLGLTCAMELDESLRARIRLLQRDLFALGARLADPSERIAERVQKATLGAADTARLEAWIDEAERELVPLRRFVLPGGHARRGDASPGPHGLPPRGTPHGPARLRRRGPRDAGVRQPAVGFALRFRPACEPACRRGGRRMVSGAW